MGLSCIPPPASLRPPKVYNILVPDVFPRSPPAVDDHLGEAQSKKFSKLAEYVRNNQAKIPKVSRRLYRTAIKSLAHPKNVGYVNVATHAYIYLLEQCQNETAPYTSNYFAAELLLSAKPLIPETMNHPNRDVQTLGGKLLAAFISAQDNIVHFEVTGPLVLEACSMLQTRTSEPHEVAMVSVLQAHVVTLLKFNVVPSHLEEIQAAVMSLLQANHDHKVARAMAMDLASRLQDHSTELASIHAMVKARLHQGSIVGQQDKLKELMQSFGQEHSDQRFTLLSALFNYILQPRVTCQEVTAIIQLTAAEAAKLPSEHAVSMLGLVLQKLPSAYMIQSTRAAAPKEALTQLRAAISTSVAQLAARVGSMEQVYEAVTCYLGSEEGLAETEAESRVENSTRLECAAVAIKGVKQKAACMKASMLPPAFLAMVSTALSTGTPSERLLMHQILEPLLMDKEARVDDAAYAETLQYAVLDEVSLSDLSPLECAHMSRLLAACIGSSSGQGQFLVALAKAIAQVSTPNADWACTSYAMVNTCLQTLKATQQPSADLTQHLLPLPSSFSQGQPQVDAASSAPFKAAASQEAVAAAEQCRQLVMGPTWAPALLKDLGEVEEGGAAVQPANANTRLVQLLNGGFAEPTAAGQLLPDYSAADEAGWHPSYPHQVLQMSDSALELEAALMA